MAFPVLGWSPRWSGETQLVRWPKMLRPFYFRRFSKIDKNGFIDRSGCFAAAGS
jgi:hypothetical protein